MLCWNKNTLYKNPKVNIISISNHNFIDFNNPFMGINFRPYNKINCCLKTKKIVDSKDILINKTNKKSTYNYDFEEVIEYRDVVIFKLVCQQYKNSLQTVKNVIIDKIYNLLIVFDTVDDMFNYISGNEYNYCYGISLNSYINLTICKPHCIKFAINNKPKLYVCTLIENDHNELIKNNSSNHFNNFIKINKLYRFSSVHQNKLKMFKETVEKIVGFKIIYD